MLSKEDLQNLNFTRLRQVVNHQIKVNNCEEEGNVYYGEDLLPFMLVTLGLLSYNQYQELVDALETNIEFEDKND